MDPNYQNQQPQYRGQEPLPNATLILILGILSIFVCMPLGIAALIMGNSSLAAYRADPQRYTESSVSAVQAGRICGIIGICIIVIMMLLILLGVSFLPFVDRFD